MIRGITRNDKDHYWMRALLTSTPKAPGFLTAPLAQKVMYNSLFLLSWNLSFMWGL